MESKPKDNLLFVFTISILVVFFIVLPAFYNYFHYEVNFVAKKIGLFNLSVFTHFSEEESKGYNKINALSPYTMNWKDIKIILTYTGEWIRYPFCLFLLLLSCMNLLMEKKNQFKREFSMEKLVEHNINHFSCINPVAGKGEELLNRDNFDKGLWKVARTPIQFCVENNIFRTHTGEKVTWEDCFQKGMPHVELKAYGKLKIENEGLNTILTQQLGCRLRDFEKMPPLYQALACAFLAFGHGNKKVALKILDTCSLTYVENEDSATCYCFEDKNFISYVHKYYKKYNKNSSKLVATHTSYEKTWLMSLLFYARKKGLLAPSQFLFCRPIDRELWYALHQCGGSVAWAEGLASWIHYYAEEKAQKPLSDFDPEPAYRFMFNHLSSQGWLFEEEDCV